MSKFFTLMSGFLLLAVAAAHAYRLFVHPFSVVISGTDLPLWISWPAFLIALLFGVMLFVEARR